MGFFHNQLIDIIEWLDNTPDTMAWRFPRGDNEIKNGAKLIVRESQVAAFVAGGKLADVFQPGTATLSTPNMPILSDLMGWKYGFVSPFKAEVYFISTKTFTDRKWGTKNPIMLRDADSQNSADAGFSAHLGKPLDFTRLRETIDRVCAK